MSKPLRFVVLLMLGLMLGYFAWVMLTVGRLQAGVTADLDPLVLPICLVSGVVVVLLARSLWGDG